MGSPDHVRSSMKWKIEEDIEVTIETVRDEEDWDGDDKRKQADGIDIGGRKRDVSDTHGSRKRLGGSSRGGSDQDDYETRKEPHVKHLKKTIEESTLDVLSTWYQDGDSENKLEDGDKPGIRGYSQAEETDRKKSSSKYLGHGIDGEKVHGRNHRRRWDEPDNIGKTVEYVENADVKSGKSSDPKLEHIDRERSETLEIGSNDIRIRGFESMHDKTLKSHEREDAQVELERSRRGKSEIVEEDNKGTREDILSKERLEEHRQPRNSIQDIRDGSSRSLNLDEDVSLWTKDKSRRDVDSDASRIPENTGRRQCESDSLEMDYERSSSYRRKELVKDGPWNDRSKGRDDSWGDRKRDRDHAKDTWKRKQDKDTRDNESAYDSIRDWELPRRSRDRIDGRSGGRKDGSRTEAVKISSKYGISSDNYDVIEIQTKPFDYGREDSRSNIAKNGEAVLQSDSKLAPDAEEFTYSREDRSRNTLSGHDTKDRSIGGNLGVQEYHSWRDDNDFNMERSRGPSNRGTGSQISSGGSVPPNGNQEPCSFNRSSQGGRGNRSGRTGRGRPSGRDNHQAGIPMPMVGSPYGPLGLPPPGPMQSLPPNMSPAPGPISPGVFIPPFQPPIVWPGARGVEMNMLGVPPGLPPVPPGPLGPRFPPNMGNGPNSGMVFSPSGPGRGMPSNMSGPNFNAMPPVSQGPPQDKASAGWAPSRVNAPPGKAPSRGEQNDYSQNFVDTGMRPQNFIRELELTSVVEDYPKLRELIQKKDEIVAKSASSPMYYKCDLRDHLLSPEFFGTKFDVILIDPPWEEYVHRAPGVTDHMEYWTFEEIMNLKIEAIADTPSFIFLWVGDGVGLEQGRQCLKKWGFRRCEDICWVKTNKANATPGLRHDSHTLFQRSKEHCLMGIKGTVRRSTDGHIIHANIDTDVIIAEEPPYGSTAKPEDMYRIIEHFALGRRRLELFGEDHNIRAGWLTVGKGLSSSNFNSEAYIRSFADEDGKVWAGVGGRNPPPDAPHLVQTTSDIESLRPKSPMKNQQQMQQQHSASIPLTTGNSNNKRPPTGNSPQNHNMPNPNQESSSSNIPSPAPWGPSPMEPFKGRDGGGHDGQMFDMYGGYNAPFGPPPPAAGDFIDYESHRGMNLL